MHYDAEKIINVFANSYLNGAINFLTDEENDPEDLYNLWYDLQHSHFFSTFEYGASKVVFFPLDGDYVVKIPFTGKVYYNVTTWDNDGEEQFVDYDTNDFSEADCENGWDYCEAEVNRYYVAVEHGFGHFFAKTECIGDINGFPIYVQERCATLNKAKCCSEESLKSAEDLRDSYSNCAINSQWLGSVLEAYGEDETIALLKFLDEEGWSDFHSGNVGYLNGKPVIFDYSDFNE